MAHIYWKGSDPAALSGDAHKPLVQTNWVYADGTTISNADWVNFRTSGKHDIIFDYDKNWGTLQDPRQAPVYLDMNEWHGSATTVTWKSLTIKHNASQQWANIMRWSGQQDTLVLRGLDIRKSKMLSASVATTIKFTGIPYFTSFRRQKGGTGTSTGSSAGDIYIRIVDENDSELNEYTFVSKDLFNNNALGNNSFTAPGMFYNEATRDNFTFLFEPPNDTKLVLEDGIYPNMDFDCAGSDTATLSFEDVMYTLNTYTNSLKRVDMLKLTVDASFNVKPTDRSLKNRNKYIQVRKGYDLDCSTFDMGYATLELVPTTHAEDVQEAFIPSVDTAYFGPSVSATQAMGMKVKFSKLVIGTPTKDKYKLNVIPNSTITCEELVIKPGGRLYGPTHGDDNSAEIHCIKYPVIQGDWNFAQVSEGIYRAAGTSQVISVSRGGTGLSTWGKQGQVLAVKSNGTGLEWSSTAGGGGLDAIDVENTDSGYTWGTSDVSTISTLKIVAGANVTLASDTSAKAIRITSTDTDTTYSAASTSAAGLVTALPSPHGGKFLRGDNTWVVPSYTTALAWSAITSKPSTFAPIIGTTSTTAMAGNTAVDNVSKANLLTVLGGLDENDTLNIGDAGNDTSVVIRGNLQVDGTTTTVNSTVVNIDDSIIKLHAGHSGAVIDQDAGIEIERGDGDNKLFYWDEGNDRWTVGSETMVAGTFIGALTGHASTAGTATSSTTSGTAGLATNVSLTDNNETDETVYLVFADGPTLTQALETEGKLTYTPNSGLLSTTGFVGALTGNADTATSATTATKATNIAGGTIGVIPYQSAANTTALLAGNDTTTKKFLTQTGDGTDPAAPAWGTIAAADVPSLAASKITSGTFDAARIPTLNQNTTGTAAVATAATVTVQASPDDEFNLIPFIADAATATGNHGLEMDGSLKYNPSTNDLLVSGMSQNYFTTTDSLRKGVDTRVTQLGTSWTGNSSMTVGARFRAIQGAAVASGETSTLKGIEVLSEDGVGATNVGVCNVFGGTIQAIGTQDGSGATTATGLQITTSGADTNYGLIVDGGRVGIGTTSPARSLSIQTTSSSYGMARFTRDSTTHGEASIGFEHSSDATDAETWVVGTGGWSNTNDFVIGQDGAMFLIETSTGNVGIGTTTPDGKLDVTGTGVYNAPTLKINNSSDATYVHGAQFIAPNIDDGDVHLIAVGQDPSTNDAAWFGFKKKSASDGSADNILTMGLWGANNLLNIKPSGNVGIGTEDPGGLLDIMGESGNQLRLSYNADYYWIMERDSNGKFNITNHQNDTDVKAITIDTTERVGIGTDSPDYLLDVAGDGRFGKTGTAGKIYLSEDAANSFIAWGSDGTDITLAADDDLFLHADDDIFFQTGGATKLTLNDKGELYGSDNRQWTPNSYTLGVANGNNANKWIKVCEWIMDGTNYDSFSFHAKVTQRGNATDWHELVIRGEFATTWWTKDFNIHGPYASTAQDNYLMVFDHSSGGSDPKATLYFRNTNAWNKKYLQIIQNIRHGDNIPATSWTWHNTTTGSTNTPTTDGETNSSTLSPDYYRTMGMGLGGANDTQYRVYNGTTATAMYLDTTNQRVGIATSTPDVPLDVTTGSAGKLLQLNDGNTSGTYMGIAGDRAQVGYASNGVTLQGGFSKGINFAVNNATFGSGIVATFDTAGTFNVVGAITAATKEFVIPHPTKKNMQLHHGSLEGPEHAVYVRGQHNASVITLPDYWEGLVDEDTITVQLTPIGEHQELFVKQIKNGKVRVASKKRNQMLKYFYFIQGERKDVEKLEVEV